MFSRVCHLLPWLCVSVAAHSDEQWGELDRLGLSYVSLLPAEDDRDSLDLLQNITGLYRVANTASFPVCLVFFFCTA